MDATKIDLQQRLQERSGGCPVSLSDELGKRDIGRPVDCHEEMGLAFGGLHLGDIHMTEANGIVLEALTLRLVPFDPGQMRDAIALQAPMSRRGGRGSVSCRA